MADPGEVAFGQLLVGGIAFMLLVGGALLVFLITYQKRLLEQQLHLRTVEAEHQQQVMLAMVEAQEGERERIGQELHDGLGTTLAAVKLLVSQLGRMSTGQDSAELLHLIENLVGTSVQDVRNVSHDLYPAVLARYGLAEALRYLAGTSQATGRLPVDLQVAYMQRLGLAQELALYRICQELLHNAWKHAHGATRLVLHLEQQQLRLTLLVEDDGCGFPSLGASGETPVSTGAGLRSIAVRVQMLGARWHQQSVPGHGVRTVVEMDAVPQVGAQQ